MICLTQPNMCTIKIKLILTSSIGFHGSIERNHGKNKFKILINSVFKFCSSCASSSRAPQMTLG